MELVKSHGLGNDYLVLCSGEAMSPEWAVAICDRHFGLGGDGVLEPFSTDKADYGVRIWNPDGSLAEKSGNGLRIFARWLVDERGAPCSFSVWTDACLVRCEVGDDIIAVEMGHARFEREEALALHEPLSVGAETLDIIAVDLGNPHCVSFYDVDLDTLPWRTWGPLLENHVRFPLRINVQFARIVNRSTVDIRIWERGAGETSASGSSSCAVAAAAVATGRLDPGEVTVTMPGGTLSIQVEPGKTILLRGPVEVVGRMTFDPRWVGARQHS